MHLHLKPDNTTSPLVHAVDIRLLTEGHADATELDIWLPTGFAIPLTRDDFALVVSDKGYVGIKRESSVVQVPDVEVEEFVRYSAEGRLPYGEEGEPVHYIDASFERLVSFTRVGLSMYVCELVVVDKPFDAELLVCGQEIHIGGRQVPWLVMDRGLFDSGWADLMDQYRPSTS